MIRLIRNCITRRKVEDALGFKLRKWQVEYIFKDNYIISPPGRGCGKTLAHQLKLILDYKAPPLHIHSPYRFREYTDMPWSSLVYTEWYAKELFNLYNKLRSHNIRLREIAFK